MDKRSVDLNHVVLNLKKKRHINPAIIVSTPEGMETIGPIDQRWEIGSVTKVFTALLLAQLQQSGRISIKEPIASYLPDDLRFPENFQRITFEDLATHQSGLPRLPSGMKLFAKDAMADPYAVFDEERVFQAIQETKLKSLPGTGRPRYSNYGFGLLGFVLERATGRAFEDLILEEIASPLELNSATFSDEGLRKGHSRQKEVGPWHMGRFASMGGLRMNATDLSKFLLSAHNKDHALATAFEETFTVRFRAKKVALGLAWHYFKDEKVRGHGGATYGASAEAWSNLRTKTNVVILGDGNPATTKTAFSLLGD